MPAIAVEAGQSVVITRRGSLPEQPTTGVEIMNALRYETGASRDDSAGF